MRCDGAVQDRAGAQSGGSGVPRGFVEGLSTTGLPGRYPSVWLVR
ncbi:hypothetical protein STRAU_6412 [Streptomyces aurantiacus JA 4570]|uniref:Uncharacterized protein n=1 Tax=Streptomyces aurantiacus JA 4570 TaxID=1286094 RepID=S4AGD2_9ACTN|nr:hypothetical protein STRAU_6412 [Streptomyces aurantiacus JA 4570]